MSIKERVDTMLEDWHQEHPAACALWMREKERCAASGYGMTYPHCAKKLLL